MTFQEYLKALKKKSLELRIKILEMMAKSKSGYIGSCYSAVEILVGLYYGQSLEGPILNIDPAKPGWSEQDYFILSKSQAAPLWYALLADLGFFDETELQYFNSPGALLTAQPRSKVPGVMIGSFVSGQGVAEAVGLAMALRTERQRNKVFVLMGDAEVATGAVWESALQAGLAKLGNLIFLVDHNTVQLDGIVRNLNLADPISDKFESMGFRVINVFSGHDFNEIFSAYEKALLETRLPVVIIFKTVKSKGIDFAENKSFYHDKVLSDEERQEALKMLEKNLQSLDNVM